MLSGCKKLEMLVFSGHTQEEVEEFRLMMPNVEIYLSALNFGLAQVKK